MGWRALKYLRGKLGEGRPRRDKQDEKETINIPTWKIGETPIIKIALKTARAPQRYISLTYFSAVAREGKMKH
jgi:hypothetical protein